MDSKVTPQEPKPIDPLQEAKSIIDQYAQKCSSVDEGNLYFAATQYEIAYQKSQDELKLAKELLKKASDGFDRIKYNCENCADGFEKKAILNCRDIANAFLKEN